MRASWMPAVKTKPRIHPSSDSGPGSTSRCSLPLGGAGLQPGCVPEAYKLTQFFSYLPASVLQEGGRRMASPLAGCSQTLEARLGGGGRARS